MLWPTPIAFGRQTGVVSLRCVRRDGETPQSLFVQKSIESTVCRSPFLILPSPVTLLSSVVDVSSRTQPGSAGGDRVQELRLMTVSAAAQHDVYSSVSEKKMRWNHIFPLRGKEQNPRSALLALRQQPDTQGLALGLPQFPPTLRARRGNGKQTVATLPDRERE